MFEAMFASGKDREILIMKIKGERTHTRKKKSKREENIEDSY